MPSRTVKSVSFRGEARELHALIGAWMVDKGVVWHVKATDFVGGCFDVTFTRSVGAISKAEARAWLDTAIEHVSD